MSALKISVTFPLTAAFPLSLVFLIKSKKDIPEKDISIFIKILTSVSTQ